MPKNVVFFLRKVKWCGREIFAEGIRYEPAQLTALKNMPIPRNAGELQQFLCALNWMRASIPQFTTLTAPLAYCDKPTAEPSEQHER